MADLPLWFRVKAGLPDSDGAMVLERRLGVERAWSYALSTWDWFVRRHPEGQIVGPDAAYLLARGAGWQGEADTFCAAMVAAQFLAVIPEGFRVKGWKEWAGYHLDVRAKDAVRKRSVRSASTGSPADVHRTSGGQGVQDAASDASRPSDVQGTPLPSHISVSVVGGCGGDETPAAAPSESRTPPARPEAEAAQSTERPASSSRAVVTVVDPDGTPIASYAARYPATARLLEWLRDRGTPGEFAHAATQRAAIEKLVEAQDVDAVGARVKASIDGSGRPTLGWHLDAIRPPKAARGVAAVGANGAFAKDKGW